MSNNVHPLTLRCGTVLIDRFGGTQPRNCTHTHSLRWEFNDRSRTMQIAHPLSGHCCVKLWMVVQSTGFGYVSVRLSYTLLLSNPKRTTIQKTKKMDNDGRISNVLSYQSIWPNIKTKGHTYSITILWMDVELHDFKCIASKLLS